MNAAMDGAHPLFRSKQTGERRQNLPERIYRQLKQRLFDFELLPGDRFTESEVAELVNASRTPVREALNRLQREGFVEVSFRSGWQVKPFDFQQYEHDVRIVLELEAIKRLCAMHPAADLEPLKRIWLIAPHARLSHGASVCALDERFHEQLVEATGNQELARIHHDITERLRLVRRIDFTQRARITATYEQHGEILRSIIERQADRAQQLMKAHIEESKAEVRKITLHMIFQAREHLNTGLPLSSG
jgi:DNA-binding GntR family transcriptional regulator